MNAKPTEQKTRVVIFDEPPQRTEREIQERISRIDHLKYKLYLMNTVPIIIHSSPVVENNPGDWGRLR